MTNNMNNVGGQKCCKADANKIFKKVHFMFKFSDITRSTFIERDNSTQINNLNRLHMYSISIYYN